MPAGPLQAVGDDATDQNFRQLAAAVSPDVLALFEQEDPPAPNSGAVIYAKDNGGKTQLLVLFSSGEPQLIAEQP